MVTLLAALVTFLTLPVEVKVNPRIALAPTTVNITVTAEAKDTNRGLTVVIVSDNYYRSSYDPDFTGKDGAEIAKYQYELRVPGHYTIAAILHRAEPDKDEKATTDVCLSGGDVEC